LVRGIENQRSSQGARSIGRAMALEAAMDGP
jgi:hypothetical protein